MMTCSECGAAVTIEGQTLCNDCIVARDKRLEDGIPATAWIQQKNPPLPRFCCGLKTESRNYTWRCLVCGQSYPMTRILSS